MTTFWKGKKVFITGHTGFKGSWLSLWLSLLNAEVIGFALDPPTSPNLFTLAQIENMITSIKGDIRNLDLLKKALKTHQPDIIFHMAAQPLVRQAYLDPVETYMTNVMGTVHLLEAARHTDHVKAIINVTTDKCYENKEWHWGYRENDRLGGYDPYSNSKACSELVSSSYRNAFFNDLNIGLASARAGNVIGGGDWAEDRLIPDVMRACLKKQSITIRYPHALRPWQHVLEPLSGYLKLAEYLYQTHKEYAESWNFGPHDCDVKPVSFIVDTIIKLWHDETTWSIDQAKHPHEAQYLKLDCAKAKSRLGWEPHWNIEKGLQETVHWYQAYVRGEAMRAITLSQINHFIQTTEIKREPL